MTKIKRQKHVKKTLKFYKMHFGIQPPYKILIDGTFCKEALHFQVNIWEQAPKYFDAEVHLLTTNCALTECLTFGFRQDMPLYGALKVISQYTTVPCNHTIPLSPSLCFLQMAKTNLHYFIATQDQQLSDKIRILEGVPLLYIALKSLNLEAPSVVTKTVAEHKQNQKFMLSSHEEELFTNFNEKADGKNTLKLSRKKISGPNPLSCKKKKVHMIQPKIKKRHRKRKHRKSVNTCNDVHLA